MSISSLFDVNFVNFDVNFVIFTREFFKWVSRLFGRADDLAGN